MKRQFVDLVKSSRSELNKKSKESKDWINKQIQTNWKGFQKTDNLFRAGAMPEIGGMYLFTYDAKTKEKLPFFDMNPLVFPIEFYKDGFLGINLHYLPPLARAALMDSLTALATDNKYNKKTKLAISYSILKAYSSQFAGFENCIKRYLYGYVRSSFHEVYAKDWDKAVLLPLQSWSVNYGKPPY